MCNRSSLWWMNDGDIHTEEVQQEKFRLFARVHIIFREEEDDTTKTRSIEIY